MTKALSIILCICVVFCLLNVAFPDRMRSNQTFDTSLDRTVDFITATLSTVSKTVDFATGTVSTVQSFLEKLFAPIKSIFETIRDGIVSVLEWLGLYSEKEGDNWNFVGNVPHTYQPSFDGLTCIACDRLMHSLTHTDGNSDYVCDACNQNIGIGWNYGDCHPDRDDDGVCDLCNHYMTSLD